MFQFVSLVIFLVTFYGSQVVSVGISPGSIGFGGEQFGGGGGSIIEDIGHQHGIRVGGLGLRGANFGHSSGFGVGGGSLELVHRIGGDQTNHNIYGGGNKNINNGHNHKSYSNYGGETNQGGGAYSKGEEISRNLKGESAHFSDSNGGKKVQHDGQDYYGGHHFQREGHGGGGKSIKKGHKKGHSVKGFKSSHHKDESGKTEEFYDEVHDEAGNYAFNGETGAFGKNGASSFKGGHEGDKFNSGLTKKTGHYGQEYITDKVNGNHGAFGEHTYTGNGGITGVQKLLNSADITEHHENSKIFKLLPVHL